MAKIREYLVLPDSSIVQLSAAFKPTTQPKEARQTPREKIDYALLARQYEELLENGTCRNRADIAKLMGTSRAWISKVLNKTQ